MKTFNDNSIEITRGDRTVRIFLTDRKGNRRTRRFKLKCSNKKHTPGKIAFHKTNDRLANFGSHLILN